VRLLPLVYDTLRPRVAQKPAQGEGRSDFCAAEAMLHILSKRARRKPAQRQGGLARRDHHQLPPAAVADDLDQAALPG
jgi:hypothetical protein